MFRVYYESLGNFFLGICCTKCVSVGTRGVFPSSFGGIEMYVKTLVLENLCRKGFDELFWDVCPH